MSVRKCPRCKEPTTERPQYAEERGRKATPQMGYFRTDTILSLEGATIQCVSYGPHELVDLEGLVDEPFGPFGVVRV